jgi:hypothetical protein
METDAQIQARIARELLSREPLFHRAEFGTTRDDFERMITADFWEVGASGRKYSRDFVLDALALRHQTPITEHLVITDFACRRLSADTWLVTYQLEQDGGRLSRRSTIWRHGAAGWQAAYHQGSLIS